MKVCPLLDPNFLKASYQPQEEVPVQKKLAKLGSILMIVAALLTQNRWDHSGQSTKVSTGTRGLAMGTLWEMVLLLWMLGLVLGLSHKQFYN